MRETLNPYLLIGFSIVMSVLGQVAMKFGISLTAPEVSAAAGPIQTLVAAARSPFVWAGLAFYGLGAAAWIVVLSKLDLSYAYPFASLSFVVMLVAAWQLFGENITPLRVLGTLVVCMGVFLISRS